jgi:peptidyl-prolyl cis-trans isomerase D
MFEFVHKHRVKIQIIFLVLIVPPFMLFGVDVYFRDAAPGGAVAKVGDYAISADEFSRALRERQSAVRRATEGRLDPAMLDNPELRQDVLETLVRRRLLVSQAQKAGLTVTNQQLRETINRIPVFRDAAGKFSYTQYQEFLRSEGMTPAMFEARLRQDILIQQVADGYGGSTFVPRTVIGQLQALVGQQREVSHATLQPEAYLAQVKLAPDAAKQHYDANTAEFRVPEQARVEYVTLSAEGLMGEITLGPDDVRKYYESNRAQFGVEESREASHILVSVEADSGAGGKEKARAKAEQIYRELQKKPAGFAEAAKKHSADPGSASQGGSLGRITRGAMKEVPEFEKALFALKPGQISEPVETKLGYHIIRVDAVQPGQVKPLEEVRESIEKELKRAQASRRFAELADGFNNVVYEQSDSLKPAAELARSAVRQSGWISRESAPPPLNNPKLLAAIFSSEALKERRNTEAVEVAPAMLIAARVIESKPATTQPFEEVRAALEKRLALREAARLAVADGRRRLDELKQGKPATVEWSKPLLVSRDEGKDLPEPALRQAFRTDVSKLPAYAGVETGRGAYTLVRVSRVEQPDKLAPERAKALEEQARAMLGQETLAAYVASLRQKTGVTVNKEQLEKGDR